MRQIKIIQKSKKDETKVLLFEYLIELLKYDYDIVVDNNGMPTYKWFDCYWEDNGRFPFYLVIDGKIAGFAFIRELNNKAYEIAEFYVASKFRKDGNSLWFANQVCDLFCGELELSAVTKNVRAIKFWDKFVNEREILAKEIDGKWKKWRIKI